MNRVNEIRIFLTDESCETYKTGQVFTFKDKSESKVKNIITVDYESDRVLSAFISFENGQSIEYAGFKYICRRDPIEKIK